MFTIIKGGPEAVAAFFSANAVGFRRPKAIRFKHGVLSPGAYINNRTLPCFPYEWQKILEPLLDQTRAFRSDFDGIASVATGGVPHGIALARHLKMPHFIVKKQQKDHGLGGLIDGDPDLLPGMRLALVEDMSSTYASSLKAAEVLEHEEAKVVHTLLLNTWNLPDFRNNVQNHSVFALCTGEVLLDYAANTGRIDPEHERIARHWLEHPEDESWAQGGKWEIPKGASD